VNILCIACEQATGLSGPLKHRANPAISDRIVPFRRAPPPDLADYVGLH